MTRRSSILRAALIAGVLVASALVALLSRDGEETEAGPPGPRAEVTGARGGFRAAPQAGDAYFEVSGLGPGQSVPGTIRVRNAGSKSGLFYLTRARVSDRPGPNGGRLSERLELAVLDVSEPGRPAVVYTGGIGPLDVRPLGVLRPGASRTYSVKATALAGQTPTVPLGGGDPYEGSSTRIALRWRAVGGLAPSRLTALLRRRDRTGPRLALIAAPRQSVIDTGRLDTLLRCSELCRARVDVRVSLVDSEDVDIEIDGDRPRRKTELRLVFGSDGRRDLREALRAGRSVAIRLRVRANDGAGNESGLRETVNLRPKR